MQPTKRSPSSPNPIPTSGRRFAGLCLAAATGGLLGAVATLHLVSPSGQAASPASPAPIASLSPWLGASNAEAHYPSVDLAEIAEKAMPSVVNISSTKVVRSQGADDLRGSPFMDDPFFRRFFQLPPGQAIPRERQARSLGSGVIVDDEGLVLTNNHVVDGADEIKVTLADNREFDAELLGADPQSDLAVVRIKGEPAGLVPLAFGDSSTLRLADTVLAIGNPFGVGQTVTMGIVSATGRANLGIADYEDFIQTDAAINPGNSGGALLNVRGELVGINTAIVSRSGGYQGIGFAIPSNMARTIMTSLKETGTVERGWLGVAIQNLDRELAEAMGIEQARGVLVADITEDSPADKAGLQRGDVILSVDGREVQSTGELRNVIASNPAGQKVTIAVMRNQKRREIKVKLGVLEADEASPSKPAKIPGKGLLGGLSVADLGPGTREKFDIPDSVKSGAVVTELDRRSAVARAGVAPGDVILQVDRKAVTGVKDFRRLASRVGDADSVLLLVARQGGTMFLLVKK